MFNKIIVGVDGRATGSDAVALAQTLAAPDAEIMLVNAFPYDMHPSRALLRGYEELLRHDALELLKKEGEDSRFELHAVPDVSPARALQEVAEDEAADLIVVGSCHRGVVGRVFLGDVSRSVLHGATCPVAVAPRGYRKRGGRARILGVGVDHSPGAKLAVAFAAGLAAESDGELRLLSVVHLPVGIASAYGVAYSWPELVESDRKASSAMLEETIAALDVPATSDIVEGVPGEELEKLSRAVDVLVLGSRGWGAAKRIVLGSTSDRVAHHAACPVILVPAPADERAGDAGSEQKATA